MIHTDIVMCYCNSNVKMYMNIWMIKVTLYMDNGIMWYTCRSCQETGEENGSSDTRGRWRWYGRSVKIQTGGSNRGGTVIQDLTGVGGWKPTPTDIHTDLMWPCCFIIIHCIKNKEIKFFSFVSLYQFLFPVTFVLIVCNYSGWAVLNS